MSKSPSDPRYLWAAAGLAVFEKVPLREALELDAKQTRWANTVLMLHPTADRVYLQTVAEEIVRRAALIAMQSPVESCEVASFFLDRTLAWVVGGMPVPKIGPALPRNVKELGEMILRERIHPHTGGKLTAADLQPITKGRRKKHVRTQ